MNLITGIIQELGVVALIKEPHGTFKLLNTGGAWLEHLLAFLDCPLSEQGTCIAKDALC